MGDVIDLKPYLVKRKWRLKSYGSKVTCPVCGEDEYWVFYCKKHIDGSIFVTAIVCTSEDCDGDTTVEIEHGVIVT